MKSVLLSAAVLSTAVFGLNAFANDASLASFDPAYLTIGKVTVEEIQAQPLIDGGVINAPMPAPAPSDDTTTGDVDIDQIINLGKKLWQIIEANKPVVNVQTDVANALPLGVQGWENLATWQVPQAHEYRVQFTNLYGMNVVDFQFRVLFTGGGSIGGKGHYLTNCTILPAHLSVGWGYKFNAQGTVASVMNAGTAQDPVAAMQLQLHWSVDTVLKHDESTENFYVKGDGFFKALGSSGT